MKKSKFESVTIDPQVLKINPDFQLYTLHKAKLFQERCNAKCYNQQQIQQSEVLESLQYNEGAFTFEKSQFVFPEHILFIKEIFDSQKGFVVVTQQYKQSLLDYINERKKIQWEQAKDIFCHIIKASYSIYKAGFWSRNLRLEHFVKTKKIWKIQSLVYENIVKQKYPCEYFVNPHHYPPQAYDQKRQFEQEELEERMIWDLGCMLIHLLLGNHKLKNQERINKFKNSEFSFAKIGAAIADKFPKQLKDILGRMCHYNMEKRMKIEEFFLLKYFTPQVAKDFELFLKSKEKGISSNQTFISKIFMPSSSSKIGSSFASKNIDNSGSFIESKSKSKILYHPIQEQPEFELNLKAQSIIFDDKKQKTSKLQDPKVPEKIPDKINNQFDYFDEEYLNPIYKDMVHIILSQIDKCHIILLSDEKFKKLQSLYRIPKVGKEIIHFLQFILNLTSKIMLEQLLKQSTLFSILNDYDVELELFKKFTSKDTFIYNKLKERIKSQVNIVQKKIKEKKERICELQEPLLFLNESEIQKFIRFDSSKITKFQEYKDLYRQFIFYRVYGKVVEKFSETKQRQLQEFSLFLIFCLAVDKLYQPKSLKENFSGFFRWKKQNNLWVREKDYLQYVKQASQDQIIADTRFMIQTYYNY